MLISIVNHTSGKLSDAQVQDAVRAINAQMAHDFKPYWHIGAELRLEGSIGKDPDDTTLPELRGDAIIYLWDDVNADDALGFHETNAGGVPFGFVFTELSKELGESWTVTLSHEALELVADPEVNLLVAGPHPADPKKEVFHWYEMCDAVQDETYKIGGIEVSNFLLPLYFTSNNELGGRNDFLGAKKGRPPLQSFGITKGGYIGFYNPETREHETHALKGDQRARERAKIKGKAALARRSKRYQLGTTYREQVEQVMPAAVSFEATPAAAARAMRTHQRLRAASTRKPVAVEKIGSQSRRND
jgi:hypothetical protein